jgi:hypothetical protein
MSNKCNLIKDILPLYVEDMVSTDTREFVSEHLEHCAECHAEFEHIRKPAKFIPDTGIAPLKRIKKDLFIKRLQTIFFTAMLACAIVVAVFAFLTSPNFFPYSDSLVNVIDSPNGNIIIAFDNKVTGYSCIKEFNSETETEVYRINAWTTTWDLYSSNRGKQYMVISSDTETKTQIFYAQNDGSEDVLIYGLNVNADEDIATLPRLILMPYFILAFLASAILAIARFFLRNKSAIIVWIDRTIFLPISYMVAHLCIKGLSFTTYSSQRDFCIIILVAMLFYFAMLTGKALYKAKRENSKKRGESV